MFGEPYLCNGGSRLEVAGNDVASQYIECLIVETAFLCSCHELFHVERVTALVDIIPAPPNSNIYRQFDGKA